MHDSVMRNQWRWNEISFIQLLPRRNGFHNKMLPSSLCFAIDQYRGYMYKDKIDNMNRGIEMWMKGE